MAQQLLTTFAAPIIAQENNASAAASKYQVATYNVSQDTFLYDHVKVSLFVVGCWQGSDVAHTRAGGLVDAQSIMRITKQRAESQPAA